METANPERRGTWGARAVRTLLIFLAGALVGANVVYYLMRTRDAGGATAPAAPTATQPGITVPSQPATPPATPAATPPPSPSGATPAAAPSPDGALVIPVSGVQPAHLVDTYTQSRGSGRLHDAIDIMAPAGTPVVAAVDGRVVKLFASEAGGITLYQFDPAEQYVYYYAHLQGYAPGMVEGRLLRRGELLGFVGATGNANPDGPHLHFAIARLGPEKKWHGGTPVNPYPLLAGRPATQPETIPAPAPAPAPAPVPAPARAR